PWCRCWWVPLLRRAALQGGTATTGGRRGPWSSASPPRRRWPGSWSRPPVRPERPVAVPIARGEMDWYLDPEEGEGIGVLRKSIVGYLGRHSSDGSDLDGAELAVAELLGNAVRHAKGPVWVTVSWPGERPLLEVRDLGPGFRLDP